MNFVVFLVYDRQILDTNMGESLLEHSTAQKFLMATAMVGRFGTTRLSGK